MALEGKGVGGGLRGRPKRGGGGEDAHSPTSAPKSKLIPSTSTSIESYQDNAWAPHTAQALPTQRGPPQRRQSVAVFRERQNRRLESESKSTSKEERRLRPNPTIPPTGPQKAPAGSNCQSGKQSPMEKKSPESVEKPAEKDGVVERQRLTSKGHDGVVASPIESWQGALESPRQDADRALDSSENDARSTEKRPSKGSRRWGGCVCVCE